MHTAAVHGVAVDGLNRQVVSVSLDRTVKFWDFVSHALLATVQLDSPANRLVFNTDSDLCAVATDDLVVSPLSLPFFPLIYFFSLRSLHVDIVTR